MKKYAIICGGTGGHIAPGIAVAERLLERNNECILVVSRREVDDVFLRKYVNVKRAMFPVAPLSKQPLGLLKFFFSQTFSFFKALSFLSKNKIDCVIGFGGFTNAPLVLAAFLMGKKIILHESNQVIGKSIRVLSIFADIVYLPPGIKFRTKFLNDRVKNIPCPIRREIFKFNQVVAKRMLGMAPGVRLILVFGGSMGAKVLTNWAIENYEKFNARGVHVYCLSGHRAPKDFEINGNKFVPFCDDMNLLYNAADVVVSQAGWGTISESMKCQKRMILVPYKRAADNHQLANAKCVEKLGHAVCVEESEVGTLFDRAMEIMESEDVSGAADPLEIDSADSMARDIDDPQNIFMVGACGAGMAPLAIYLSEIGFNVYGWDDFPDLNVKDMLIRHGIIFTPDKGLPRKCDCVVVSSAIDTLKSEGCLHARKLGLSIFRRGEFLAKIIRHKKLLAIVGSHGKTSVCARIVQILNASDRHFDYLVGGFFRNGKIDPAKYYSDAEWVIAEIDESDCTIKNFSPEVTVALNYDDDHIINYRNSDGLKSAFRDLFARTKSKVYVTAEDDVFMSMISGVPGKFSILDGLPKGDFVDRNNQIADRVAKDFFGVECDTKGEFSGVKRRNDLMCKIGDITFVQDYAHHPTEIEAILAYARSHYQNHRITAVFQPHRVSRTKQYFKEFAEVLRKFDGVILVEVYCAFEERLGDVSSGLIGDMLEDDRVLFVKNINDLDTRLSGYCASLEKGKKHLILFICAGDLLKYAQLFVNGYRANVIPGELGQGCDICSRNVSLKTKTSFGCNATARVLMEPRDEKDLVKALRICGDLSLDYILLAGGSNVIFPDGIYDKAVLKLAGEYWQRIESMPNGCLRAYAGAKLSDLHAMACKEGFQCFEFLECIPGTVGGALAMNAGAHGHSISEFALNVRVFSSDGVEKILSTEECKFAYRSSNFGHGLVIACVELQLRQLDDSGGSCRKVRELTQPKGRTFGSIFKNPSGYYAGRLVEECGLKGYCRGDAAISEKHANFLVNNGEASAGDVEHVIDRARYEVFDKFGVFLETEVRLLRK